MMDPNSSSPLPPSEQPTTPSPQPIQTPQPTLNQQPFPYSQKKNRISGGAVFAIIGGALLIVLITVGIIVSIVLSNKDDTKTDDQDQDSSKVEDVEDDDTPPESNEVTATALGDYSFVCTGKSIANARPYQEPVRAIYFYNDVVLNEDRLKLDNPKWKTYALDTIDAGTPNERNPTREEVNAVICLDRDDSTAVKVTTCQLLRSVASTETAPVDHYSVKYKMTLYEAKTGKKVQEFAPVNGNAAKEGCPRSTIWDADDPKFYADPDLDEVNARLADYQ